MTCRDGSIFCVEVPMKPEVNPTPFDFLLHILLLAPPAHIREQNCITQDGTIYEYFAN